MNKDNNGFLQTKLKNNRAKSRKLQNELESTSLSTDEPNNDESWDLPAVQKNLKDLQDLTLPDQIELTKNKLKGTLQYRRQLSKNNDLFSPFENCKYFFLCPELVS